MIIIIIGRGLNETFAATSLRRVDNSSGSDRASYHPERRWRESFVSLAPLGL